MFKFDNKISLDGIAIILAMVGACVWIGTLSQRVIQLEANDVRQQDRIERLTDTQNQTSIVLARITSQLDQMAK